MQNEIVKTEPTTIQKVAKSVSMSEEQVLIIQKTVAKGCTPLELAYFLNVCKSVNLNPFNKEIWCYKDNRGNQIIFAGRDGFLARAQQNPVFDGIRSAGVYENDEFEVDIPNGVVHHKIKSFEDRGELMGAYCFVFRKSGEPTIELARMKDYDKGYSVWKTHPEEMIKKVAESKALKKAMGISMVQSEHDFELKGDIVEAIDKGAEPLTTFQAGIIEQLLHSAELPEAQLHEIENECCDYTWKQAEDCISALREAQPRSLDQLANMQIELDNTGE